MQGKHTTPIKSTNAFIPKAFAARALNDCAHHHALINLNAGAEGTDKG
jgi:hypothetical protein